ncbi:unnamed protein product [Schistosoma margrebowiei]|uniref:Uncharacterized protein n=1 Tax=Schistosoma margrebowiei TaxID=48269 RepID=A0A183LXE4_9TREM|nr:unnamed protein product [Schistosoma margrebowiei]
MSDLGASHPSGRSWDRPVKYGSSSGLSDCVLSSKSKTITVFIFILINVLNYMDRFTIAGVPENVKSYYKINDSKLGQLQTMFFVFYTILSPIAGYLGDRWKRKRIMQIGLSIWIIVTLASSFVPAHLFSLFLATRCFVGIGEASYSTLAPTILSDLFMGNARTKVLGLFYFAAPVGSGLGFIVGSEITRLTGSWQWSLRITPILGLLCIILLSVLHSDPPRGEAEGGSHMRTTSWWLDIKSLLSNQAFMFISCGYTCVCFVLGSLSWFAIDLIHRHLSTIFFLLFFKYSHCCWGFNMSCGYFWSLIWCKTRSLFTSMGSCGRCLCLFCKSFYMCSILILCSGVSILEFLCMHRKLCFHKYWN